MSALTGASRVGVTTTDGLDGKGSFAVPSDSGEAVLATVVPIQPGDSDQTPAPSAALLIPGYDELAASQVMPRLEALDVDELESIRSYESSHRGRRTILARIAQMQVE